MAKPYWARKLGRTKTTYIGDDGQRRTFRMSDIKNHSKDCDGGCTISGLGRRHGSGEEAMYCNKLHAQQAQGEISTYCSQKTFYLKDAHGKPCGSHVVDFYIERPDGKIEVHEYKGQPTREWLLKAALFTWNYPEIEYETKTERDLL